MELPNYLLFTATFADESQIVQNAEDKSETTPDKNCFFDVLERQKTVPLVCFVLIGEGYPIFGVDLRSGHFEVNHVPFMQHEEPIKEFRLCYFRDILQHYTATVNTQTREQIGDPILSGDLGYIIGWEAEYKGQTIKRIMKVHK